MAKGKHRMPGELQAWIDARNGGDRVPARTPENPLEDAPGSYAMLRLSAKVVSGTG